MFQEATKERTFARVWIDGPTGSGKTLTALLIARGLAGPDGKIAVIDADFRTSRKYSDKVKFDVVDLIDDYHPQRYIDLIELAARRGYDVLVIDPISHEWQGTGGVLELVDKEKERTNNPFGGWKVGSPLHKKFVDAIIKAPLHVVCTCRVKMEYVLEADERGKLHPVKKGLAPIQREGMEYEFDVCGSIDHLHDMRITKSRISSLDGACLHQPGEDLGERMRLWLTEGAADPPPLKKVVRLDGEVYETGGMDGETLRVVLNLKPVLESRGTMGDLLAPYGVESPLDLNEAQGKELAEKMQAAFRAR